MVVFVDERDIVLINFLDYFKNIYFCNLNCNDLNLITVEIGFLLDSIWFVILSCGHTCWNRFRSSMYRFSGKV